MMLRQHYGRMRPGYGIPIDLAVHASRSVVCLPPAIAQHQSITQLPLRRCFASGTAPTNQPLPMNNATPDAEVMSETPVTRPVWHGKASPADTASFLARGESPESVNAPEDLPLFCVTPFAFSARCIARARMHSHSAALLQALRNGVTNVVDLGSPSEDGVAHQLFRNSAVELMNEEAVSRSEIVVLAKGGSFRAGQEECKPDSFKNCVQTGEESYHSLDPALLDKQITQTLDAAGLDTLDLFMIDRPELQIGTDGTPDDLYKHLSEAFKYLETKREEGRIQAYGIESNGFTYPLKHKQHMDVSKLLSIAKNINTQHGFAAVNYPLNLLEPQAAISGTQKNGTRSIADFARDVGLLRFSHRPLEASVEGHTMRLVDFPSHDANDIVSSLKECWNTVIHLERNIPPLTDNQFVMPPKQHLSWAQIMSANADKLQRIYDWEILLLHHIKPTFQAAMAQLHNCQPLSEWRTSYSFLMEQLLHRFTWMLEHKHHEISKATSQELDETCPELRHLPSLQAKALAPLHQASDCVILGMHHPAYVSEVEMLLSKPQVTIDWSTLGLPSP
eukprot:TRINITY_DN1586_c2_g1_i1.p1 TRINITY_DN1586_c2_g1~~TRINITY_DN1586_c2_g1_i1.p1  ORF type:complete len:562 (+),score=44.32 TRINITY_DN1586_c2_g1_i1:2-1687(+)